jgi:hypothetical protein
MNTNTTVVVEGKGSFTASEKMMARFSAIGLRILAKMVADHTSTGVTFWRELGKDTLVVVAASMLATDAERVDDNVEPESEPKPFTGVKPINEARPLGVAADTSRTQDAQPPADTRSDVVPDNTSGDVVPPAQPPAAPASRQRTRRVVVDVVPEPKAPAGPKMVFVLRCTLTAEALYLRRDQPRKPGDVATYKAVELAKASRYASAHQANLKLAEVASLYDDREHQVVLEAIEAAPVAQPQPVDAQPPVDAPVQQ